MNSELDACPDSVEKTEDPEAVIEFSRLVLGWTVAGVDMLGSVGEVDSVGVLALLDTADVLN